VDESLAILDVDCKFSLKLGAFLQLSLDPFLPSRISLRSRAQGWLKDVISKMQFQEDKGNGGKVNSRREIAKK